MNKNHSSKSTPVPHYSKDTLQWFKRDILTIKKSFLSSFKYSLLFLIIAAIADYVTLPYYHMPLISQFSFMLMLIYFILIFLGYFLMHIMVTKGYNTTGDSLRFAVLRLYTEEHDDTFLKVLKYILDCFNYCDDYSGYIWPFKIKWTM